MPGAGRLQMIVRWESHTYCQTLILKSGLLAEAWVLKMLACLQVAALVASEGLTVDPNKPYAELWYGFFQ